ncbi:MAG TPA: cytochrome b [Dyella sp.]|uniref:cytochrome b n=1 Tax=Dyella sp. TaxID=1869338 RepID=UPI002F953C11
MNSTITARYTPLLRRLHWIIFGLVLVAYIAINLREMLPRGSGRGDALALHALSGIVVFLLVLPRLFVRLTNAHPPIVPGLDRFSLILSKATHAALYLFLVVQPIMGIVTVQLAGKPLVLFGMTVVPPLFGPGNHALAKQWEDIHGTVGTAFYYVIGLHILAALWHHFGRKDNTLRRML